MSRLKNELLTAQWHNEPPQWAWNGDILEISTGDRNDFWQGTFYGFHRDDGHFLGRPVRNDFTAVLTFDADYQELYDQAGLMVRRDRDNWVKTGIEYSDGITNFSVVITTDGRSDWSVVGVTEMLGPQKIRLTKVGNAVIVHHAGPDGWRLMRLGATSLGGEIAVGPMACSPQRSGLKVSFLDLEIGPAIEDPLHAV